MAEPSRSLRFALLANQSALVRRFVLAEILGPPRGRTGPPPASVPAPGGSRPAKRER